LLHFPHWISVFCGVWFNPKIPRRNFCNTRFRSAAQTFFPATYRQTTPSFSNMFIKNVPPIYHVAEKYYLDTSLWQDFFENRNEPNLPKGDWAHKLLGKITENNGKIIYSDMVLLELGVAGYPPHEIGRLFENIKPILIFVESTEKQVRKAKDLSAKRGVPKGDALHAVVARDNKAALVTLDNHFKKLLDITKPKRPQDLI